MCDPQNAFMHYHRDRIAITTTCLKLLVTAIWSIGMKIPCFTVPVVQRNSHRWRFEATDLCSSTVLRLKRDFCSKWGRTFGSWWVWWSFPPLTLMIGCLVPEHQAFLSLLPRAAGKMRGDKRSGDTSYYAAPSYRIFWWHRRGSTWVLHWSWSKPVLFHLSPIDFAKFR